MKIPSLPEIFIEILSTLCKYNPDILVTTSPFPMGILWSAKSKNIHKITWLVSIPSVYYPLLLLRSNSCCIISFYIPYIKSVLNNSIVIAYFLIYIACFIKLLLLLLIKYMLLAVIVVACKFAKISFLLHGNAIFHKFTLLLHGNDLAEERGSPLRRSVL